MAARMLVRSAGSSPPFVMLIRFADHENWKSLTAFPPIVVVKRATAILLGCAHESLTAGKSCVPQRPASPFAEPCSGLSHESWANRSIKVLLLEILMSPRMFSSRQFNGTLTCATQSY